MPPLQRPDILAILCTVLFLMASGTEVLSQAVGTSAVHREIQPEKELLIRDLKVVNSKEAKYPGPFSFGGLMERLKPKGGAEVMVRDWLRSWMLDQTVNGYKVAARPRMWELVIEPWIKRDGQDPTQWAQWKPNLAHAPFQLLAIVNRLDLGANAVLNRLATQVNPLGELRKTALSGPRLLPTDIERLEENTFGQPYYGKSETPPLPLAEGRFVFCVTDAQANNSLPGGFTIILEYSLAGNLTHPTLQSWATAWHDLGRHADFDNSYLSDLTQLTERFTSDSRDRFAPQSLRIRTNESCLGDIREMREFNVNASNGTIVQAMIASTPLIGFASPNSPANKLLGAFLEARGDEVVTGRSNFPLGFHLQTHARKSFAGVDLLPIMGGSCHVPETEGGFRWEFANLKNETLRQRFSLQTCSGCHAGETQTADCFHIKPRGPGEMAGISPFLERARMLTIKSPDGKSEAHLAEMSDRITILSAFLKENGEQVRGRLADIARRRAGLMH